MPPRRGAAWAATLFLILAACSGAGAPSSSDAVSSTATSTSPLRSDSIAPTTTVSTTAPSTTIAATTTTTTTPTTLVTTPGTFGDANLKIAIAFQSQVADVDSTELADTAVEILNHETGWIRSGFWFTAHPDSELRVVLAEGDEVDELCLPLDTHGQVSCQNGSVVALNADRWRVGGDDWTGSLDEYRHYLITHEVGHLIGLRHPGERCPTDSRISAVMEPQTNNLEDFDCIGNGVPMDWEIEWATRRPAVIGPDPEWDGPRPTWPSEGSG